MQILPIILQWHVSTWRVRIKLLRLHQAMLKAGYNPNQPRAPAGTSIGGQWIGIGRNSDGNPDRLWVAIDISGFSKHGINRAIERAIPPAAILDAINNPIRIRPRPDGSTQFIGGSATVVLSPAGVVITVWPIRSF
ncbi:MAG: hypothetical protein KIT02_05810 [Devosia sp.]|uniref:hypothetical protein n=1 Tax=Devosia sp. TaxID=1871048 RepID=UPI0024C59A99|nr:hypothetical protein [Devosia sp.]UYO00727.1 MAG: hypothetical protein KIT02_05810 [Devosia sp.]